MQRKDSCNILSRSPKGAWLFRFKIESSVCVRALLHVTLHRERERLKQEQPWAGLYLLVRRRRSMQTDCTLPSQSTELLADNQHPHSRNSLHRRPPWGLRAPIMTTSNKAKVGHQKVGSTKGSIHSLRASVQDANKTPSTTENRSRTGTREATVETVVQPRGPLVRTAQAPIQTAAARPGLKDP